jgi:hypothetical protein
MVVFHHPHWKRREGLCDANNEGDSPSNIHFEPAALTLVVLEEDEEDKKEE